MSKISTYEVAPVPKLSDKLIGTSVGGEIEDITYNFTLLELLELFLPVIPANNLQGVLDYGNTATQDINLFGTITTTNLEVTDTANLFITYLNEETHIVGSLFDSADSVGTSGQVLTSTGEGVEWFTLPPIFTPNLQQVLEEGNTADLDIILDADLEAINITADTANIATQLSIQGTVVDYNESAGTSGQVLESTVTGVQWVNLPVYSATSPLLFDSGTNTFSIQVANSTQGGYLTANDWVTFDGKQNAGAYITALTGEATATGPGSVPITLNNASVIAKVLTGLNITGGSISATDSILTAFGKVQNQINGLMGGVQYQGVWNAATNTPTLTSSVGTQGHYYIVNVAGSTDLNGITDWKVGDWAIFSGGSWQKVDNTESVTSVNGQTGAVSLTTDNIPEGTTNLYYLNSRARGALSFAAGSGAYNNLTGVITIPTDNSQILNGAGYITLTSISATAPLTYNNLTGVFSIPKATALVDGYLSATDWSTFNNKQNYLGGTGLVKSTAGTITYITDNSGNWNTAYNDSIISASVTGTATKTLTLNQQDGGTIQASWTDLDTGLTSVGVSMPAAFSVANSPLTANGTIAITGAGTSLQYIDGTGALQTFPGLTGFVPYTGATQNVDLGEYGISAGYFQADLTPTGALQVGRMQWNSTDGTMDLRLMGNNVTLQIGEENVTRVVNKSGVDLLEANYQVVRVRKVAEGGAQGQRLAVVLAQGNNENNSTEVIGIVTETINVNQEGFVTAFGEVKNINTTGSLQGETWVDGEILYLSDTIPGQLTKVRPIAPNHAVIVGYVTYAHANNGKIYLAIDTGYELGELHNVYAPSPTANQSIYWNTTNSRYELNTIGGILGYTPANAATLISTTAPLQGGGDLSTNRTFSITQAGASTDGYLSSTDWNTFNNKQPAGSYVPTSRLLSINGIQYDLSADRSWSVGTVTSVAALTLGTSGTDLSSSVANGTTTPVITLNVPTASAANRGALSAADWSTFNTKVGSVTASSPLASSGGQTPNITIQQSSGSQDGYLSSTDWTTFNNKQAAGNYITSLTGEATASGPGAAAVTLNNASVTGKVLTGVNITGGSISATDSILTAFGKVQNQINGLVGGSIYQGTWNAATNTPALASGVGTKGYYYIVSVAGTTNLDGITDWFVGDWAIFDGTAWQQVDNTDAVVSVNGQTGAVSLTTDNIPEGSTNQYYLNSRARSALSFTAGSGAYNSTTGVITIPTNTNQLTNGASFITLASLSGTAPIVYSNTTGAISITQAGTSSNGYLSSTDWNTFNNKAPSVSGGYLPLSGGTMTGQIVFDNVAPLSFIAGGNTGTYQQTTIYVNQNNTSGSTANGIFIERGYTDTSNTEIRHFVIGARGGTIQWKLAGTGYSTQYDTAEVKPSADGNYFVGRSSSSANTPFRAYQSAGDGYIDLATAAGTVITKLSGYAASPNYTLAKFGIGKSSSITYTLDVDGGSTNDPAASFVKQAYGTGSNGIIARFINNVSTGYSSYIFIGSDPGTDWKIGKNITNPTAAAPNFEIVDSSGILGMRITPNATTITFGGTIVNPVENSGIIAGNDANLGFVKKSGNYAHITTATGTGGIVFSKLSTSALSAATISSGTLSVLMTLSDSGALTASSFIKSGGTSSQYLMADGSVSTLTNPVTGTGTATYLPIWSTSTGLGNSKISQPDANNVLVNFADTYAQGGKFTLVSTFVSKFLIGRTNLAAGAAGSNVDLIYDIAGAEIFEIRRNYSAATFKLTLNNGASVVDHFTVSSTGAATFSSSVTAQTNFISGSFTDTISVGLTAAANATYNYVGYSGYWGLRTSQTGTNFCLDTYNGGTPKNVLRITQFGDATFAASLTLSSSAGNLDVGGVAIIRGNGSAYSTHEFTTGAANVALYQQRNAAGTVINKFNAGGDSYINGGAFGLGTSSPSAALHIFKSAYSGNQFKTYAELSAAPTVLSYTTADGFGLILNMYEAIAGSPYTRYADIVANTGDISSSVIRFFTKNYNANAAVALTLASTGSATFSSSITANGNITITKVTPAFTLRGIDYGNSGAAMQFLGWASSNPNWQVSLATEGDGGLHFIPSTANGGTTFTTPTVTFFGSGAATFTNSIGIGRNPLVTLDVRGNAWINRPANKVDNQSCTELPSRVEYNNTFVAGQSGYTIFYYPTYNVFRILADYDGNIGGVQPDIQIGFNYLTVRSSGSYIGYVGVNTATPTARFEVKAGVDGEDLIVGRYSGGAAKLFRMYQSGADGFLELRTGADSIVTKLSGYTGTPNYTLAAFGFGKTTASYYIDASSSGGMVASFSINQSGAGTGQVAQFINSSAGGYSSFIYIGSAPGTDWKIGKNISNPTGTTYNFEIVDSSNNLRMQINNGTGAVTFSSSVTATAFYESSDSRLKNLIKDNYRASGIETIKPKLYIKDGREEVGYFAQDVKDILSTAVSINDAGFLSLSYTQVHTAKIAIIEDEVDVLKKEVAELKVKLQKYEA